MLTLLQNTLKLSNLKLCTPDETRLLSLKQEPIGTSHESMIKSITHQLLKQSRDLFDMFAPTYRRSDFGPSVFSTLLQLSVFETICVLDGLDESMCRDTEGKATVRLLANATMYPKSRLKMIILSRPYRAMREVYGAYDILMEAETRADITRVVEHGLQSLISTINYGERDFRSSI